MQATTTPKLANGRSALQAGLAAVLVATAIAVGATVGIGLAQGAISISAPAPVVGDYEASGVRRTAPISESRDRALDGAAFRKAPAPVIIDRAQDRGMSLSESITLGLDGAAFRKAPALDVYPGAVVIGGWMGTSPTSPADAAGSFLNDADARHGGAFDKKVGRAHR